MKRLRQLFGSVRVRVALLAGLVFAVTLVVASVLLLRALESRLVGSVRADDQAALQSQKIAVLASGLPDPGAPARTKPLAGANTITFQISDGNGQTIVATADGKATGYGPSTQVAGVSVGGVAPTVFDTTLSGVPSGSTTAVQLPIDESSAQVLGVAGQQGPFLVSSTQVYPGLSLSTASSLAEVNRTLTTTRTFLWYAVPALVLLVVGLAWLVVGRALRPVHTVTSRASTISSESLHERVPVPAATDEVSELATTINSMLDRIESADLSSRRLISDASHELRTPITVMRTELEVARRDPDASWADVSTNVLGEIDRLQDLVDDLLLLARMNERGALRERFSLLDTVRDVAGRRRAVEVSVIDMPDDATGVEIVGDGQAVQRALDHVVANAARHASSRVEVLIAASSVSGEIVVHVDDDGPGIAADDRTRVLERFERLDEGRSRDAGGSGLGLSVAADVMTAHGGGVSIVESPLGGARVSLAFAERVN